METTRYLKSTIRDYYGHNGHECKVKITLDGEIHRYGSPNPTDRSKDYWQYLGTIEEWITSSSDSKITE